MITGATKVNKKIKEILSLDYQQFKQISMIAQGEFLKLLVADGNERTEVLRNIFKTHIYEELQKKASEQSRKLGGQMKEVIARMEELCKTITGDEAFVELSKERRYEELFSQLKKAVEKEKRESEYIKERLDEKREAHQIVHQAWEEAKRKKQLDREIHELEAIIKEAELSLVKLEQKRRELEEKKTEIEEKREQLLKEREIFQILVEQETLQKQKQQLHQQVKELRMLVERYEQAKKEREKTLEQCQLQLVEGAKIEQREKELLAEQKELNRLQKEQESLLSLERETMELQKQLKQMGTKYAQAEQAAKEAREAFEREEQCYRHNLLGIEAQQLEEGSPCPLCGSKTHPQKAVITGEPLGEAERKRLKQIAEQKEETARLIFGEGRQIQGNYVTKKEEVRRKREEWNQSHSMDFSNSEQFLAKRNELLKENIVAWNEQMNQYKAVKETAERLKELEAKEQKKQAQAEEKKQEKVAQYEQLNGMEQQLLKKLCDNQKTKEELKSSIEKLEIEVKEYDSQWQKNQEQREQNNRILYPKMELLHDKKRQFADFHGKEDEKALMAKLQDLKEQIKQLEQQKQQVSISIYTNQTVLDGIKERWNEYQTLEQRYGVIGRLDQLLNGRNAELLKLEQYVLSTYFDKILQSANQRFYTMSNGRYELSRVEKVLDGRGKNSLDMEVLDHYTGRKRSIKTLSGGESFKAALSLALGLSDMIQSFSGGIEVDVLFVDEGFGSLDEESLNQAIQCLLTLADRNRLIGIISHVPELKERIDKKIEIIKGHEGSKIIVPS